MPLLSKLIQRVAPEANVTGDAEITHITTDSRQVKAGSLFAAMPGVNSDGAKFIPNAVKAGAVAVMAQANLPLTLQLEKSMDTHRFFALEASPARGEGTLASLPVPIVYVSDMRAAVSKLAAAFYPNQPEYCIAITGTDGKTSTADFIRQLAQLSGLDAASIGTLGLRSEHADIDASVPSLNTSPEPILLHHTLQVLREQGVRVVAIETSSHGLDQKRADGVKFAAGAFTNLTRDHLDYHGTVDAYFAAKQRLFSDVLPKGAIAVLNRDDAQFPVLAAMCAKRTLKVISFGASADADYRVVEVTPHAGGLDASLVLDGKAYDVKLPLYGAFQLSNMLAAIGLLQAAKLDVAALVKLLPQLKGVPGRLEKISTHHGAPVFIDYAHTPAALENILKTLRPHTAGKLHVVFGCGGDRDAGKRPEMGKAATQFADHVIVTDDNPRSENPAAIRAAILRAAPGAVEVGDRDEAIRAALTNLQAGDVLVVAGKGHETTQTIGNKAHPFSDADHIRKAVAA